MFKIIRTCNILYIMHHKIISPDIDGYCNVYSSLKFAFPLAEKGLLICVLYRLVFLEKYILRDFYCRSYTSTFIATVQL